MLNIANRVAAMQSISSRSITGNGTTYGTPIALNRSEGAAVIFDIGTVTDGTYTLSVQESLDGGANWSTVAASDLDATLTAVTTANDPKIQEVGYKGTAGLIRPVIVASGVTSGGPAAAYVVLQNIRLFGVTFTDMVPLVTSARVEADGQTVHIYFNQSMLAQAAGTGWSITADAVPLTVNTATLAGTVLTLEVDEVVNDEQTVLLSYNAVTGSYHSNYFFLATFASAAVANASISFVAPVGSLTLSAGAPAAVAT